MPLGVVLGRQAAARAGKAPSALRAPLASAARRGPPRARAWCSRLGLPAGLSGSCWPCTLLVGPHFPSGPGRGGAAPTGHWWSEAPAAAWQGFHAAPHGRLAQERGPEASPAGAAALQRPASQPHSALRAASASGRARAGPFAAPASSRQAGLTPRWELRPWGSMRPALGTGSSLDRTDGALAGRPWRCRCGPPAGCTAGVGIPASVWPGCLGATSARPRERGASRVLVGCPRRGAELAAAVPALTLGRPCPRGLPASPLMASLLHAGVRTGPQPERERPQTRPGEGNAAPPGRLGGGGRGCGAARASPLAPLCSLRSPRPPWAPDPGSLRPSPHSASAGSPPREAGRQRPRPGRRSRQAGTSGLWVMQRPLERTPL